MHASGNCKHGNDKSWHALLRLQQCMHEVVQHTIRMFAAVPAGTEDIVMTGVTCTATKKDRL